MITKGPSNTNNYRRFIHFTRSAREGERYYLEHLKRKYEDFEVILPGYIGFSSNEGSGLYDPIIQTNAKHSFYKMKRNLEIDIDSLEGIISKCKTKPVVFIVHYFGLVDSQINEIIRMCNEKNCIIIEDCAHAMYSDIVDGKCGCFGDALFYSLHKMLPIHEGGNTADKG